MKHFAYFRNYHHDEHDSIREISKEEYELLSSQDLTKVGYGLPDEIETLIWEDIYDRTELDVLLSDLDCWDFSTSVEIPVC
jgi:hypothetical protein